MGFYTVLVLSQRTTLARRVLIIRRLPSSHAFFLFIIYKVIPGFIFVAVTNI